MHINTLIKIQLPKYQKSNIQTWNLFESIYMCHSIPYTLAYISTSDTPVDDNFESIEMKAGPQIPVAIITLAI